MKQPPLSATFPAMDGRSWAAFYDRGIARIFPSAAHPGYYHCSFIDRGSSTEEFSLRPVKPEAIPLFLGHSLDAVGIKPSINDWRPTKEEATDPSRPRPKSKPSRTDHVVYFLRAGPFVKIGKSVGDPRGRMQALKTGCPYPIEILAFVNGGLKEERALHKRFAHLREHGEWFRHEGALAEYVKALQ